MGTDYAYAADSAPCWGAISGRARTADGQMGKLQRAAQGGP